MQQAATVSRHAGRPLLRFVDSHTHIDQILKKIKQPLDTHLTLWAEKMQAVTTLTTPAPGQEEAVEHDLQLEKCITISCSKESVAHTRTYMEAHPDIHAAFGLHPCNAEEYSQEMEDELLAIMDHPKVVAWGEMGLDYCYLTSSKEKQQDVFAKQLKAAASKKMPLVIHTRDAEEDTIALLKEHTPKDTKMHIHCFTSSWGMAEKLLAYFDNVYFGFTGVVTFGSADNVRQTVANLPLDRILLETDGPYMAPKPFRGKPCHSGMVPHTLLKIAQVKGVTLQEAHEQIRENTRKMYGI